MPAVCRVGDILTTGHGCSSITAIALSNTDGTVKVNSINVIVVGAPTVSHPAPPNPPCPPHVRFLNVGSSTVRVNSIPVGRIGDWADQGFMLTGSSNVNAG